MGRGRPRISRETEELATNMTSYLFWSLLKLDKNQEQEAIREN